MTLLLMTEMRISMATVERRYQSETYLASNPRFGPLNLKAALSILEIIWELRFTTVLLISRRRLGG